MEKVKINICMGSSCFARGNEAILDVIKEYLTERGLRDSVEFKGHLCKNLCNEGPNVEINGVMHSGVTEDSIVEILNKVMSK